MKRKVKVIAVETGKLVAVLSLEDMKELGIHVSDRIKINAGKSIATAITDSTTTFVEEGEIALFEDLIKALNVKEGDEVDITVTNQPQSIRYIRKKMEGKKLESSEIRTIIQDVVDNNLSDVELTAYITSAFINGYDMDETVALTKAMVETGQQIDFGTDIVDKHCIGGVAGNRTTMIVVPILAAAGYTMPKTSSRAITSPAGTSDTMEVLAPVEFSIDELRKIVKKTNGCIIWGGAVNLAPADDRIIQVEYPLSIDPEGQVLASVMAKKKSVGSDYVVIDIPVGEGAKIADMTEATSLAHKFIELGKRLDMSVECLITDGSAPIGSGIGPALEARDVLLALQNKGPVDLINKSLDLAGILFELSGKVPKKEGRKMAEEILKSGKAYEKMKEIIAAQGGDPQVTAEDIPIGDKTHIIKSPIKGTVRHIDNKKISKVARNAGAPKDQGAGVYLHVRVGDEVEENQPLFTIYSENEHKLTEAIRFNKELNPVRVGGVILKEVTE
ncbi:MAG: AMP phosphorylase [Candidatus Altiarchaeota archaeon]